MNKPDTDNWNQAIEQARLLLKDRKRSCMEIARLAMEVCEVSWGGNKHDGQKTLKDFATEAHIHYSTLSNWCSIKKNIYDKLRPALKSIACQGDLVMAARMVGSKCTIQEANEAIYELKYRSPMDRTMVTYCSTLHSILNHTAKSEVVALCKVEVLEHILFLCQTISKNIHSNSDSKLKAKNHDIFFSDRIGFASGTSRVWRISEFDQDVAAILKEHGDFIGPTNLAEKVLPKETKMKAKLRTLRALNKLTQMGKIVRNTSGHYKFKNIRGLTIK